jgi:predicted nucleotidyltransferase
MPIHGLGFQLALAYSYLMKLSDLHRLIMPEREALHARGVTAIYVFGSLARGEAGPESDVDLIVDYDPASGFNLFDLAGVHRSLSERLGVKVDVVTRGGIHRRIRDRVLKEAVRVF